MSYDICFLKNEECKATSNIYKTKWCFPHKTSENVNKGTSNLGRDHRSQQVTP